MENQMNDSPTGKNGWISESRMTRRMDRVAAIAAAAADAVADITS